MANGTAQILPVIDDGRLGLKLRRFLMTIAARHGNMSAGEHEVCLFVPGERERGRLVTVKIVAPFARIEVRRCRKLSRVPISVAIGAALKLDLKQRVLPFWDVALCALEPGMPSLQRIRAGSMLLHREGGGLPPIHRVTRSALPAARTFRELPFVRIGSVAVHTLLEYERLLEVPIRVAPRAIDAGMFSLQRIFSFRMVEFLIDGGHRYFLPAARVVAGLASLREAASMRILMAIRTQIKRNARVPRLIVWPRRVTLAALHLRVQPGQRISRLRVIELPHIDCLPVVEVVALLARRAQTPFVRVLMASPAGGRQSEVGSTQVFDLDGVAFLRADLCWSVAAIATDPGVLALKDVSSLFVIEGFGIPLNQRKVFAIVLGVTTRALLARSRGDVVSGVKSPAGRKASRNLGVAVETLQCSLPAKFVATGAVGSSVQRLVRSR